MTFIASGLAGLLIIGAVGCSSMQQPGSPHQSETVRDEPFAHATSLLNAGDYEGAFQEYQRIWGEKKNSPDLALFNMGLISAYSTNPRKDYVRGLNHFKALVQLYPASNYAEQAKIWIQVIEEHQRILAERQKLIEEKRTLTREREALSQDREKLKYMAERSRQLDLEIEKRRRQTIRK
jgi:outer membrane protein assembly factor BamD (BamD/ComL family)